MSSTRYFHWQNQGMWIGYFELFPDYLTQGETLTELKDSIRDLYRDLTVARFRASGGSPT